MAPELRRAFGCFSSSTPPANSTPLVKCKFLHKRELLLRLRKVLLPFYVFRFRVSFHVNFLAATTCFLLCTLASGMVDERKRLCGCEITTANWKTV